MIDEGYAKSIEMHQKLTKKQLVELCVQKIGTINDLRRENLILKGWKREGTRLIPPDHHSEMSKVESIFKSFPSLFHIKRDAIDKYPLWRDEQSYEYYLYISHRILNEFIAWRKMAIPYIKHCEKKAHQYDRLKESQEE